MIEVQQLSKNYHQTRAVNDLSFTVRPGHVTGFLGPNGAGKSTTMRMMLELDRPTGGRVLIDGKRYSQLHAPLRQIGALLEAKAMHGGRTAYDHLLCLALSNNLPKRRVDEVLDLVGLSSVAKKRSKSFSLGMGQRLGIAAALLGDPQILLFDEPVNGLDPEGILWVRNLMKQLASEGRTVFVSSHLMSEMALTAEHLIVIGRGQLLADTSMADFIAKNSRSFVRVHTPEPERMRDVLAAHRIDVAPGPEGALEAQQTDARTVGDLAAANQLTLHELSPQSASLEDAFMQLTAQAVQYQAGVPSPQPQASQGPGAPPPGWGPPPAGSSPAGGYGPAPDGQPPQAPQQPYGPQQPHPPMGGNQ